jgi:hypothetical protein
MTGVAIESCGARSPVPDMVTAMVRTIVNTRPR